MNARKLYPLLEILAETESLAVGHEHENIFLLKKSFPYEVVDMGNMNGMPVEAIISSKEDWVVVGGSGLIIWQKLSDSTGKECVKRIGPEKLGFVDSLSQWSESCLIIESESLLGIQKHWILDMDSLRLKDRECFLNVVS